MSLLFTRATARKSGPNTLIRAHLGAALQQTALEQTASEPTRARRRAVIEIDARGALLECAILVVLALLPLLFFWRLFTPNPLDTATIVRGDFTDIHYPYRLFLARSLASGDSPFWNPYAVAGHSSLGDIQYQTFYPVSLAIEWLQGAEFQIQSLEALVVMHVAMASVFTYLFARRLVPGRTGPTVAALTFAFGGYLTSFPVQQVIILQVSVWLPLILLLIDMALVDRRVFPKEGRAECFVLAAMAVAMAVLAGHPQTLGYVAVGAIAYSLFCLWDVGFSWRRLMGLVAIPILAVGLTAIQLLPSFQHLQLTARTDVSFGFASSGFALTEALGIAFPTDLGGRPLYVGLLPLVLALIATLGDRQGRERAFWAVLAFVALLVSFGGNTFAQPALYATTPVLQFFRNHERAAFLVTFAVAILAAYGASDILQMNRSGIADVVRRTRAWLGRAAGACLLLALCLLLVTHLAAEPNRHLFGHLADRAFFTLIVLIGIVGLLGVVGKPSSGRVLVPVLVIGLVIFDLFSTNWQNNLQPVHPAKVYSGSRVVDLLRADRSGPFRVASEGLLPGDGSAGTLFQLYDVVGNSPLELDSFHVFDQAVPEWQRWQLLNVKYVVTKRQFDDGRLLHRLTDGDINLYEIAATHRLPRAYMVNAAMVVRSREEALEETKTVDPLRQVILTESPGLELPPTAAKPSAAQVTISTYRNTEMQIRVTSPEDGVLVLSEVYYPGWAAEVDGNPVRILEADYLLRGIPLRAGEHRVRLVFQPSSLVVGTTVSTITLGLAILAIPAIYVLRRRQPSA